MEIDTFIYVDDKYKAYRNVWSCIWINDLIEMIFRKLIADFQST